MTDYIGEFMYITYVGSYHVSKKCDFRFPLRSIIRDLNSEEISPYYVALKFDINEAFGVIRLLLSG